MKCAGHSGHSSEAAFLSHVLVGFLSELAASASSVSCVFGVLLLVSPGNELFHCLDFRLSVVSSLAGVNGHLCKYPQKNLCNTTSHKKSIKWDNITFVNVTLIFVSETSKVLASKAFAQGPNRDSTISLGSKSEAIEKNLLTPPSFYTCAL